MFIYRDELEALAFPCSLIPAHALRSDIAFFCYCPLTPQAAFVSSPLLLQPDKSMYWEAEEPRMVLLLNEFVRHHSNEFLIAPMQDPYGPVAAMLVALDQKKGEFVASSDGRGIVLYTRSDRFAFLCLEVAFVPSENPLRQRLQFRVDNLNLPLLLSAGMELGEVIVYDKFRSSGGMRGARILSVAINRDEFTVLEADPSSARIACIVAACSARSRASPPAPSRRPSAR